MVKYYMVIGEHAEFLAICRGLHCIMDLCETFRIPLEDFHTIRPATGDELSSPTRFVYSGEPTTRRGEGVGRKDGCR
jgi:hypothetical protein